METFKWFENHQRAATKNDRTTDDAIAVRFSVG
jgi:hypothetical protein